MCTERHLNIQFHSIRLVVHLSWRRVNYLLLNFPLKYLLVALILQEDVPCLLRGPVHPGPCCTHLTDACCRSHVLVHLYQAKEYTLFSLPFRHLFLWRNKQASKNPTASVVFMSSLWSFFEKLIARCVACWFFLCKPVVWMRLHRN